MTPVRTELDRHQTDDIWDQRLDFKSLPSRGREPQPSLIRCGLQAAETPPAFFAADRQTLDRHPPEGL